MHLMGRILVAVILSSALAACSSSASEVTGDITKLDRMALPAGTLVTVELRDTSLADAPAVTISTDKIELEGNQLPVPYVLEYDEDEIVENNTYTVFSRVTDADGTLIYITDTAYPVITRGNPTDDVEVLVVPVG